MTQFHVWWPKDAVDPGVTTQWADDDAVDPGVTTQWPAHGTTQ